MQIFTGIYHLCKLLFCDFFLNFVSEIRIILKLKKINVQGFLEDMKTW